MAHTVAAARAEAPGERAHPLPGPRTTVSPLALTLLEALDRAGIRYCHWKGDPRAIDEALSGISDLDLLIDHAQAQAADAAMARCGFKRALATPLMSHPAVADYLALDSNTSRLLAWRRELSALVAKLNRRRLRIARPMRRTLSTGGVMVAFLGSDGAGKSTLTRALASLLAQKLDVFLMYFGSGDGPGSLLRWPLRVARRVTERLGLLSRPARQDGATSAGADGGGGIGPGRRYRPLQSFGLVLWALALAVEKRRKLRASWQARSHGMLVLTDRYPPEQLAGCTDVPLR